MRRALVVLALAVLTAACGADDFRPNDYFQRYPICQASLLKCVETDDGPICLAQICNTQQCYFVCTPTECAPACEAAQARGEVADCSDPCAAIQGR